MMLGVITIILNGNSNISNGVLQGIGKPNIPMINAAIALVVDVIAMAILLFATDLGVYAIVANCTWNEINILIQVARSILSLALSMSSWHTGRNLRNHGCRCCTYCKLSGMIKVI